MASVLDSTLWSSSFDALAVVDDQRRYLDVNPATEELFQAPARSIMRKRVDDFTAPLFRDPLKHLWRQLEHRGQLQGPYEMRRADGVPALIEFRAVRQRTGREFVIVARKIVRRPDAGRMRLTPRELEVLQLAADGSSTRVIADQLVLSPSTVKTHFEHIYEKLGVRDRTAAVAAALRGGLIL